MTYQEVNDRLTRVQTALQSLQDGSYANQTSINVPQMTSQLQEIEAKLQEQLLVLSEAEKTAFINGQPAEYTDEKELQKFKDNQDVKSIKTATGKKLKEQEGPKFSLEETKAIAREIGKAVAKGLKSMGDELATMKVKNIEEGSFDIHVQYKKDTSTDDFSFHISGDDLHLTDFSFDKVVGSVGVKPSGEPIVHVDVIANELVKHWKSQMREGMSDDEFQQAQQNQRLEDHPEKDMIKKIQALIAKEKKIKEGEGASEEEEATFHKKLDTLVHNTFGKRSEEENMNEAPEGMSYFKVSIRDARKAEEFMGNEYRGQFEMNGSNVYYFEDESIAHDAMMDLGAKDIEITDSNLEESVKEEDGGDLDVGHQDDEPAMLKNKMYRAAKLANMLYDKLDAYDKLPQEVDFPDWWQAKLTNAKDLIQSCYDYLDGEEGIADKDAENTQPDIASLALENVNSISEIGMFNDPVGYEKSKPEKSTYTKKYVSKGVYDIFKHGKKVKTVKDGEGAANAWMNNARRGQKNEEVNENGDWPKEHPSRHGDMIFRLAGEKNGKASYEVLDAENDNKVIGRIAFGSPDSLKAYASDYIKPQGGRQSTNLGESNLEIISSVSELFKAAAMMGLTGGALWQLAKATIDPKTGELSKKVTKDTIKKLILKINPNALKEDHSKDPNGKYVVRPCKNKKEPWAVWEGETRVKGFAEKKDAQAYADKQNKEQGLNEGESTCCGKCGRKHVKGTKCKTPYLKGKDHCRTK